MGFNLIFGMRSDSIAATFRVVLEHVSLVRAPEVGDEGGLFANVCI